MTQKMKEFEGIYNSPFTAGLNFPKGSVYAHDGQFLYLSLRGASTALSRDNAVALRDHLNDILSTEPEVAPESVVDYSPLDEHTDALNRFADAMESSDVFDLTQALVSFSSAVNDLRN